MSNNIKQKLFVVEWQNEETWIFTSEEKAIKQVESLTGKKQNEWDCDNGDSDEYGRAVYYTDAIWGEE